MALRVKASRVLAVIIVLLTLWDYFSFSTFDMVFVLAGIVQLICWTGVICKTVDLSFSSFIWSVLQDSSCCVF